MTTIADVIAITINVGGLRLTQKGFGTPMLVVLAEDTVFTPRSKEYADLTAVAVDFAAGTKPHQMAQAVFSQENSPKTLKIGREEIGDADLTAALNAIKVEDNDWYGLAIESVTDADILLGAAFIEAEAKIFVALTEQEDVIAAGSSDIASVLQAATRNRTALMWHQHAGFDDSGGALTAAAADGTVTVTETAHGAEVGDPIRVLTSANAEIQLITHTISAVPDANLFEFVDPDVVTIAAGPDAIPFYVGFTYANCAWLGLQLATNPGSTTWKFKQLSGIDASSLIDLTTAEEAIALGKAANIYTLLGATGKGFTHESEMASARFIDIQRGIDFIEARMGETIAARLLSTPKIPYTDAGMTIIEADIQQIMNQAVGLGILGPLLDSTSGELFRITIPKVKDQTTADRANRKISGITVVGQLAGAVHSIAITINAQV